MKMPTLDLILSYIKCLNFRIVKITLCDKTNKMSEAEFIAKMQELTNKSKEVVTFYAH